MLLNIDNSAMNKTKLSSLTGQDRLFYPTCIQASTMKQQRETVFATQFRNDLQFWVRKNPKIASKILKMVEATAREPFQGTGKPEPLVQNLSGFWSRRIDKEHRLVYEVTDKQIKFVQCRFHYED